MLMNIGYGMASSCEWTGHAVNARVRYKQGFFCIIFTFVYMSN